MAKLNMDELAAKYGYTAAFLNTYPEIKNLVQQAVAGDWSPEMWDARFKNTNFWRNLSDQHRKMAALSIDSPGEWGALWNRTQYHVINLIGQMGGNTNDWNLINKVAGQVIWEGWNDERSLQEIGMHVTFGSTGMAGGKAGETQMEINKYAFDMGVKNADTWSQQAVRDVLSGKKSVQDVKNEIMRQSIAAFPSYEAQFKTGATLNDIAQPYLQSMSTVLEIAPGQVNLFDPTIRNALNFKGSDGKVGTKPLWQFQSELRSDPRWKKTQNAQDATMGTAHKVLQDFGIYY